jgi:hypothetical protein
MYKEDVECNVLFLILANDKFEWSGAISARIIRLSF